MSSRNHLDIADHNLAFVDFGGAGTPVLFLNDFLGRATTWAPTAQWLPPLVHAFALDQRGQGWSSPLDETDPLDQFVADAGAFAEHLAETWAEGAPIVVGHGLGALVGWTLAARRSDLVRALVVEDQAVDSYSAPPAFIRSWFETWPLPFGTLTEIDAFFAAAKWPLRTPYFREAFRESEDGYRPFFEFDTLWRAMAGWNDPRHWESLEQVQCPALVVHGIGGTLPEAELKAIADRLPHGRYAGVEGAGHIVHYDQPDGWRAVVEPFLTEHAATPERRSLQPLPEGIRRRWHHNRDAGQNLLQDQPRS
jgi:pimeloyl-ACP methyl ester carboxylesterase